MIQNVFGLIYAGEENLNLRELVNERSVAAMPVGGRYRAVDFLLSNMVHSGIRNVGIITQRNYKSLMDHLGSGKEWDLSRKIDGLFMLPPYDTRENTGIYRGICDAVHNAINYVDRAPQQFCLLAGSYTLYSGVYDEMMRAHIENNADITMLYNVEPTHVYDADRFQEVRLATGEDGRVTDIELNSNISNSDKVGMDIYLMRKDLLEYLVEGACSHGRYNFVVDVLLPNLKRLRIQAIEHKGYVGRLQSVSTYYKLNMDMLDEDVQRDLFYTGRPVYTKVKDEPPVKYLDGANVKNCILGNGCEIHGTVENSVLFRGVYVAKGAVVRGSIVMQDSEIHENCTLENVIIDKDVNMRDGRRLIGDPGFPVIIRKGAVV